MLQSVFRYSSTACFSSSLSSSGKRCPAALLPGKGLKQLYDEGQRGPQYSVLGNLLLTF